MKFLAKIFAVLRDTDTSLLYKAGAIMLFATQYYLKRRHHQKVANENEIKGLNDIVNKVLDAKFVLLNKDKMV